MKTADVFPSRFLTHEDFEGDMTVTIEKVWLEEMQAQGRVEKIRKPVIEFGELDKPLVCNKTNWLRIVRQHGDESDGWPGKQVTLGIERGVKAFGELVDAIRVRPAGTKAGRTAPAAVKFLGDWKNVTVHFGKCKGKKLGELNGATLNWFQTEWSPKPWQGALQPQDLQFRAALDASLKAQPAQTEAPLGDGAEGDDVPF